MAIFLLLTVKFNGYIKFRISWCINFSDEHIVLKFETACSSEILVPNYQTTRSHKPEIHSNQFISLLKITSIPGSNFVCDVCITSNHLSPLSIILRFPLLCWRTTIPKPPKLFGCRGVATWLLVAQIRINYWNEGQEPVLVGCLQNFPKPWGPRLHFNRPPFSSWRGTNKK